jgi:hypothetical protein
MLHNVFMDGHTILSVGAACCLAESGHNLISGIKGHNYNVKKIIDNRNNWILNALPPV